MSRAAVFAEADDGAQGGILDERRGCDDLIFTSQMG
jgi:hypothetical protein